jgi:predicted membrane channel-forming protein YqfA (hemolysin III family)
MTVRCDFCEKGMEIDYDIPTKRKMYWIGMSWMALPILVIILAYSRLINYPLAFSTVIAFHFGAMYYLIKRMNYKTTN